MTFAQQLQRHRARLGLTQPNVAKALGIPPRTYWEYEHGVTTPPAIAQEGALARLVKLQPKGAA